MPVTLLLLFVVLGIAGEGSAAATRFSTFVRGIRIH